MKRVQRRCITCDRPLGQGKGRPCVRGCGAWLCRVRRQPQCSDVHGQGCPHHDLPNEMETAA